MTVSSDVRKGLATVFLPPIDVVIPEANRDDPSDEHDIAYNAWCNEQIKTALLAKEAENAEKRAGWDHDRYGDLPAYVEKTMVMTEYPGDTTEFNNDSRDVVALDRDGEIVVIDSGVR